MIVASWMYVRLLQLAAIHAGLECGLLKNVIPDLDAVSFGPTIRGAHSPEECVHIPSVEQFYNFLLELLQRLAVDRSPSQPAASVVR